MHSHASSDRNSTTCCDLCMKERHSTSATTEHCCAALRCAVLCCAVLCVLCCAVLQQGNAQLAQGILGGLDAEKQTILQGAAAAVAAQSAGAQPG